MTEKQRTVRFIGEVNEENMRRLGDEVWNLFQESPQEEILLHLTSGGGNPWFSHGFAEMVRAYHILLTVVVLGSAGSAALDIWLCGWKQRATPGSLFLFHPTKRSYEKAALTAKEHDEASREQKILDEYTYRCISQISGKTIEEVEKFAEEDRWITAEEAINFGLLKKEELIG